MKAKKAFTLLEIIFVVIILGIIASMAISNLDFTKDSAKIASIKEDIRIVVEATKSSYLINDSIDNFSDIVQLNQDIWTISTKELIFNSNDNECIKISINNNSSGDTLSITLNSENSSSMCTKLSESITNTEYKLNGN